MELQGSLKQPRQTGAQFQGFQIPRSAPNALRKAPTCSEDASQAPGLPAPRPELPSQRPLQAQTPLKLQDAGQQLSKINQRGSEAHIAPTMLEGICNHQVGQLVVQPSSPPLISSEGSLARRHGVRQPPSQRVGLCPLSGEGLRSMLAHVLSGGSARNTLIFLGPPRRS